MNLDQAREYGFGLNISLSLGEKEEKVRLQAKSFQVWCDELLGPYGGVSRRRASLCGGCLTRSKFSSYFIVDFSIHTPAFDNN